MSACGSIARRQFLIAARRVTIGPVVAAVAGRGCVLLPAGTRAANRLKNRTALPGPDDIDRAVTLEALLRPGDDTRRWSPTRAAVVTGYVIVVKQAGIESANRFAPGRRDTHIEIGARPDAPPAARVILEVTPPIREWAASRGLDWSTAALQQGLLGRRCRFEGWLFFDAAHAGESENTSPGRRGNWRATAWELHPVTAMHALD